MDTLKEVGWTRAQKRDPFGPISESDMKAVFKMVDMDKNGVICNIVSIVDKILLFFRMDDMYKRQLLLIN
jgi:hypothetical protein